MTSLSVSIVTHNGNAEQLHRAIEHLANAVEHAIAQNVLTRACLTVVDNASAIQPIVNINSSCLQSNLIINYRNAGFGSAHNQSILTSNSHYHLVLNPDAYIPLSYLSAGITFLEQSPSAIMVVPLGQDLNGNPVHLSKRYPSLLNLAIRGLGVPKNSAASQEYEYRDIDTERPWQVELASGCCLLCKTANLKTIGGFDEKFFLYFEDFDLSLRLKPHGEIHCLPQQILIHEGGNASRKGLRHIVWFIRSAVRFFNLHGWKWI